MERKELVRYLDEYLRIGQIQDYGPQGLQVEADNREINRIALAVDVAPPIIQAAANWQADMLLVHHGVLWRDVERIAGPLGERIRLLLQHGINLYAAHLPLDVHPEVGNNAVLARRLGVTVTGWFAEALGTPVGLIGQLDTSLPVTELAAEVERTLETQARLLAHGPETARTIAIITGIGVDHAAGAAAAGADTFITGETSHAHYWAAADYGINLIFAGHYTTETVGVQALGQHLVDKFNLEIKFFDFPTEM